METSRPEQPSRRGLLLVVGGYLLLALALFAPALLGGRLFFPLHTEPLLPWRTEVPLERISEHTARGNPELSDKLWLFHPDTELVAAAWRRGELPTWNPSIVGGVPFLGQALYGSLDPLNALLFFVQPLERAYAWSAALHVVVAALGAFWLARRLGITTGPAWLAGLLFAAGGPLLVRYHLYMTFHAAVWVPWLLAAVHAFCARPSLARWLLVPLPIALVILSGFPQTGLYGVVAAALMGSWQLIATRKLAAWRPLLALAAASALGIALAAAQILPVEEASLHALQRKHDPAQQQRESASPGNLVGYALPGAFMDSKEPWSQSFGKNPLWNLFSCEVAPQADGTALPIAQVRPSTTESTCYLGALGLVLLAGALVSRSGRERRLALALAAALALCWSYALGAPWLVRAVALLPHFDIGEVRRILPTAGLFAALLAALGLQRFLDPAAHAAQRVAITVAALVALACVATALLVGHAGPEGLASWFHDRQIARYGAAIVEKNAAMAVTTEAERAAIATFLSSKLWSGGAWFAAAALLLAVAARWVARGRIRIALVALALFATADLATLHFRVNPFVPAEGFFAPDPLLAPLAADRSGGRIRRYAPDWQRGDDNIEKVVLPPNLGASFGLVDGEGYLVMLPTRYARWLRALEPERVADETVLTVGALPLHQEAALRSPLLDGLGVLHVLTRLDLLEAVHHSGSDDGGWSLAAERGEVRVYENREALPFAWVVPEAWFLPAPPADDAIGTAAEGFAQPGSIDAEARLEWHRAALREIAGDATLLRRRAFLEGAAPAARDAGAPSQPDPWQHDHFTLALASSAPHHEPLAGAQLITRGTPPSVAALDHTATSVTIRLVPGDAGFLVLAEGFDPGWTATIDGTPTAVLPANVAFRGVVLPPGAREVLFRYQPRSVRNGVAISLSAAALLAVVALVARVRRVSGAQAPPPAHSIAESAPAG